MFSHERDPDISIQKLLKFAKNDVFEIIYVQSWLSRNERMYLEMAKPYLVVCNYRPKTERYDVFWVEPEVYPSKAHDFLKVYKILKDINVKYSRESYFEEKMIKYRNEIMHSKELKYDWLKKNEELGMKISMEVIVEGRGHPNNPDHLCLIDQSDFSFKIYIDSKDLKHTIDFAETFWEEFFQEDFQNEIAKEI